MYNLTNMPDNTSDTQALKSGYDLPVYGLKDGSFSMIPIVAISALGASVVCVCITIIAWMRIHSLKSFFKDWQKRDRFVIYMAICDGTAGVFHLANHINVFVVQDHVHPKGICAVYGFGIIAMFMAQHILVCLIAVNAFALLYFGHNLNFGKCDWKLLLLVYGVPVTCSIATAAADKLGPTGAYCLFDGVTGTTFQFYMETIPIIAILATNIVLYITITLKVITQLRSVKQSVGRESAGMKATHKAVKAMTLFVVAYVIQWWAAALLGFWGTVYKFIPQLLVQIAVFFTNIGGVLNLFVFSLINCRQ